MPAYPRPVLRAIALAASMAIAFTLVSAPANASNPPRHGIAATSADVQDAGPSTTTLSVDSNTAVVGQSVTATVVVTGSDPTGSVTIVDGGTPGDAVPLQDGSATVPLAFTAAGDHTLTAIYSGDDNNQSSESAPPVTVHVKLQAQATISAPGISVWGAGLTVTGSVFSGEVPATGAVHVVRNSVDVVDAVIQSDGTYSAAVPAANLALGSGQLSVVFDGDDSLTAATAATDLTIVNRPSTTSVTAAPSSTLYGSAVTVTVVVSAIGPVPTGSVSIAGAAGSFTSTLSNGQAEFVLPATLAAGAYTVTAAYSGGIGTDPSQNQAAFSIGRLGAVVLATVRSSTFGTSSVINLEVTGQQGRPSGMVIAVSDGVAAGHTVLGQLGTGAIALPANWRPGVHAVQLTYSGDTTHVPAAASAVVVVGRAPSSVTTRAVNSAYGVGSRVGVAVRGAGSIPAGAVAVYEARTLLGYGTLANGAGQLSIPKTLRPGRHTLRVQYLGGALHLPSAAAFGVTITPGASSVRATTTPTHYGSSAKVRVTLAGAVSKPVGLVRVYLGGRLIAASNAAAGVATISLPATLQPGTRVLTVVYAGSSLHLTSRVNIRSTVSRAAPKLNASAPIPTYPGRARITFTVRGAAAAPSGRVTVARRGVAPLSVVLKAGRGTVLLPKMPAGAYSFKVTYAGDSRYLARAITLVVRIPPARRPVVTYKNCKDVWNKLGRSIYPSDPGFQPKFDGDKDGIGCEEDPR